MRLASIAASAAVSALLAAAAPAVAEPYVLDKSHAQVSFSVDHLGFSVVHGVFREFDAEIDFDPEAIEATKVSFTIDAASVDTFWPQRDEHIRSADFLDVESHPEITFVSKSVKLTSDETAEITGDVTIRGVTREETFAARLNKIGPSPFNPDVTVAGFSVSGELDRTAYGVDYAAPAVGGVIPIRLDFEMSPRAQVEG